MHPPAFPSAEPGITACSLPSWEEFCCLPHAITLLGMSGIGKTRLSTHLRLHAGWFHFSADYRIGTRYLAEPILDNIKYKIMCMEDPFVADLLRSDSIYINHNITVDNLDPVSTFLGLYGDAKHGGLPKSIFLHRRELYGQGEIASMQDIGSFIDRAHRIYRCQHFINDSSGSLCEIIDMADDRDPVLAELIRHTLILYLDPEQEHEVLLRARAESNPKPMYYHPDFIHPRLVGEPEDGNGVDPGTFARGLFADLLIYRRPRYHQIAARHGFVVGAAELDGIMDHRDSTDAFLSLIYRTLQRALETDPDAARKTASYLDSCAQRLNSRDPLS